MTSAQLINQTSGACEWYTPQPIIEAARKAMGGIDLDPASSKAANERVRAVRFFDQFNDGLLKWWSTGEAASRVFMNHPFGRKRNAAWINKLLMEVENGRVRQACCITYASTSERWFAPLLRRVQCFLTPRTNYVMPDGSIKKGVQKGSVVTYFGNDPDNFAAAFADLGVVKLAWSYTSVT